jgi:hypothetical protein
VRKASNDEANLRTVDKKPKIEVFTNANVLHYDIETYVSENQTHVPYALGCMFSGAYQVFCGDDVIEQFIRYLGSIESRVVYLNAFNGANFDHYIVLRKLVERGTQVKKLRLNNGSLISGEFKASTKKRATVFRFFDLCKLTVGSLDKNLKTWLGMSKGDFDHNLATRWEDMPERLRGECLKYLEIDVKGLGLLYEKMNTNAFQLYERNLFNFISTSQFTFSNWQTKVKDPIYLPNSEQEAFFRPSIYGGRTYLSKKEFYSSQRDAFLVGEIGFDDIEDYLIDQDVVSLYPAAMAHYAYPIGPSSALDEGDEVIAWNVELRDTRKMPYMGIFEIEFIPNKKLAHAVLPRRSDEGLRWTLENGRGTYTSVDIDNALELGYTITLLRGFYWKKTGFVFTEYITQQFQTKANSEKDTPQYLLAKLMMNGLYGKMIQRPIYVDEGLKKSNSEIFKFFEQYDVHELEFIHDLVYVRGTNKDKSQLKEKITKPSYLGAFVLAYSRRIMLSYLRTSNPYFDSDDVEAQMENDIYYTDTDSIQIHARNHIEESRDLGGITNDLGSGAKILRGYWIAPKLYMLEYVLRDGTLKYHFKGKGVPTEKLNEELFRHMNAGGSTTLMRDFQMIKIGPKRNSKQQHLEAFSILHKKAEDTARTLNKTLWAGRVFRDNTHSLAIGHLFAP